MLELLMSKITKPVLLILAYAINQNAQTQEVVSQAFDQLFSLGLLCIVAFMLYREWKGSQKYSEGLVDKMGQLIENNTKAINSFREEQQRFREDMKYIHKRIDANRELINRGQL